MLAEFKSKYSPQSQSFFGAASKAVLDQMPFAPPILSAAVDTSSRSRAFAKGAVKSATLGAYDPNELAGSVMEEHPNFRRAGEVAGFMLPYGLASKGVGMAARGVGMASRGIGRAFGTPGARMAARGVARTARGMLPTQVGTGAVMGGTEAGIQGEDISEGAVTGGALFGGLGLGGKALGWVRRYVGERLPRDLMKKAFRFDKLQNINDIENESKSLAENMVNYGKARGTMNTILQKFNKRLPELEGKVQRELSVMDKEAKTLIPGQLKEPAIETAKVASVFDKEIAKLPKGSSQAEPIKNIYEKAKERFIEENPEFLTPSQANKLRRGFDSLMDSKDYLKDLTDNSLKVQADRILANSLRRQVAEAVPGLKPYMKEMSVILNGKEAALNVTGQRQGFNLLGESSSMFSGARPAFESVSTRGAGLARRTLGRKSRFIAPSVGLAARQSAIMPDELLEE